jgi:hypothetical protein
MAAPAGDPGRLGRQYPGIHLCSCNRGDAGAGFGKGRTPWGTIIESREGAAAHAASKEAQRRLSVLELQTGGWSGSIQVIGFYTIANSVKRSARRAGGQIGQGTDFRFIV